MLLPKQYGGPQINFEIFSKIIRKVAYHNISAAWLTYFYPLHNSLPSYLPQKGMDEIVNDGGLICLCICTSRKSGERWRWLPHFWKMEFCKWRLI